MIVMGRIVAPFGIKGWVRITPFGDDPGSWGEMPQWWISRDDAAPDEAWLPVELIECRPHGTGLVAALKEIPDRNAAEAAKGWFVGAPREAMPEPGEEEYYWADLIGLSVINRDGEALGEVAGLMSTGAHDVLRAVDGDTERLIPFVAAYVLEVDATARRITVDWQKDW
jgi:16S rRNA processing protein RimM